MHNINHIMFPTDFSSDAENALPFALEIAKHSGAKITLFHVIEAPAYIPHDTTELPQTHSQKARSILEQVVDNIRDSEQYRDLQIESVLQNGTVTTEIMSMLDESGADLVVMGTKGKTGMNKILFGSIASKIMLDANIPVLAIPKNSQQTTFDPIVFASDYRQGDWPALKNVLEWAETFNSDLSVLHVAENHDFRTDITSRGFKDFVQEKAPSAQPIQFDLVIQKQFLTGIADYLTDHPVGMLVLVRYDHNWLEMLTNKNHTKELSYYTKVPLLILPDKSAQP